MRCLKAAIPGRVPGKGVEWERQKLRSLLQALPSQALQAQGWEALEERHPLKWKWS
jgi:hypothetical protein